MFLIIPVSKPLIAWLENPTSFAMQQGRLWPTLADPRASSDQKSLRTVHPDNLQVTDTEEQNAGAASRLYAGPRRGLQGAGATWGSDGPTMAEATQMARGISHDRETTRASHLRDLMS
jgi:hypothetical protein